MTHEVVLKGYTAITDEGPRLPLGTADSYGIEQLHLTVDDAWLGLTITATYVNGDTRTRVLVDADGRVVVPPEATAVQTMYGSIVFCGTADGVQRISVGLPYCVLGHAPASGAESDPTPDIWQQYVSIVQDDAKMAQVAAEHAMAAAVHAPVVRGITWWVWSQDAAGYVDTGQLARGPEGAIDALTNTEIDAILR